MTKIKLTIMALTGTLALSATAVSSASAAWFVNGTELTSGRTAALATTATVDSAAVLSVPAVGVEVECKSTILNATKPEILGGTSTGKAESLVFGGCETVKPTSGCELESQPIKITTSPITATASLRAGHAPADLIVFSPQSGKELAEIPFDVTDTCAYAGEEPVKGKVLVNAPTGQSEEELQAIEGLGSAEGNDSLEIGGDKAYLEGGDASLALASCSPWSFK